MTADKLNQVIENLEKQLNQSRLNIDDHLFARFVDGSPDEVLKAIESQMNKTLDDRDDHIINAIHEIKDEIKEAIRQAVREALSGKGFKHFCKEEYLPTNTR